MSIERALFDLLPLANPAQDPDNTLKIPDFESGGPFKTTIWQKGHNSGDLAMSIQIKGIKANGKQYDFTSPVTIGATADALKDAIEQLYKDNQGELGLAKVRVINGPSAYESWVVYIVSGVAVEALINTADSEFTGFAYSGVTDPYTLSSAKATPVNEETYLIEAKNVTGGGDILGAYLGTAFVGDLDNGPFTYSGVQATDDATAVSLKSDIETAIGYGVNGAIFQSQAPPEVSPTVVSVSVNNDNSGFDVVLKLTNNDKFRHNASGGHLLSLYTDDATEISSKQINTTQLIV